MSQSSVYQAIAQLRRELGGAETEPRYIATIPRKGCRLIATVGPDVTAGNQAMPSIALPALEPNAMVAAGALPRRPWVIAAAVLAAVGIAALAALQLRSRTPPPAVVTPTIAVLQFNDLSADASNPVFCAGLTDEVLNTLARMPNLRVIGRTSSARFGEGISDIREIGGTLGATHVLEGSLRRTESDVYLFIIIRVPVIP